MALRRTPAPLETLMKRLESIEAFDGPAKAVSWKLSEVFGPGPLKDALSGTQLGHAVHPMLTDVVIGSFVSATALDVIGGDDSGQAAERLIALGIAAYLPTAVTGASDWADGSVGNDSLRRVGVVHAVSNSAALGLYTASLAARRRGGRGKGAVLGLLGAGALGFAGYLGGHLTYAQGVGVDQTVFDAGPQPWTKAADASELNEGEPHVATVDGTPVLILREGERVFAIHDRCSHRGCSLAARGEVTGDEIECTCHGSRFRLEDGALLRGPATRPQPAFDVRERDGKLELRARHS
jgi:nitrite reductase/ring-hydroxylating ferredoxin subunit